MAEQRLNRYLVGRRNTLPADLDSTDFSMFGEVASAEELAALSDDGGANVEILADVLRKTPGFEVLEVVAEGAQPLLVVAMAAERAKGLEAAFGKQLIVEPDAPLDMFELPVSPQAEWLGGLTPLTEGELTVTVTVTGGDGGTPVANATVYVVGSVWLAKELTKKNGKAKLTLYGETEETLRGLLVKPQDKFWSYWLERPKFVNDSAEVTLQPLHISADEDSFDWGHEAMGLAGTTQALAGRGVKIGVIDSGLFDHDDVGAATGVDFTGDPRQLAGRRGRSRHARDGYHRRPAQRCRAQSLRAGSRASRLQGVPRRQVQRPHQKPGPMHFRRGRRRQLELGQ